MPRQKFLNVDRWRELTAKAGLAAVVVASPSTILYCTGALLPTQLKASPNLSSRLVDDRVAFAVVVPNQEPILIVSSRDEPAVRNDTWASGILLYDDVRGSAVAVLQDCLLGLRLGGERVGVESAYATARDMKILREGLPSIRFVPCDAELNMIKAVKTPVEIEILQKAGEVTAEAIWHGLQVTKVGETEKDLADRIAAGLFDRGADDIYLTVLGAGENTFHTHNKPGARKLEKGDLIRMDFGGKFDGYASDLARMGVVGKPSQAQSDMYKACREVQLATMDTIRAGTEARQIYENCRQFFAKAGFTLKFPHVGHAFAMGGHDYPMFFPKDTTVIETDMIFYVEPIMSKPEVGLIQIEDLVHVTARGPKVLTGARDNNLLWSMPV
jgi:Xaa-Pro dipeptidase